MTEDNSAAIGSDPSLLLVDDDEVFVTRLARAMERRGFQPRIATSVAAAREALVQLVQRMERATAEGDIARWSDLDDDFHSTLVGVCGNARLLRSIGEYWGQQYRGRRLILPHPRGGRIDVTAPLPEHMVRTWDYFSFDKENDGDPFAAVD